MHSKMQSIFFAQNASFWPEKKNKDTDPASLMSSKCQLGCVVFEFVKLFSLCSREILTSCRESRRNVFETILLSHENDSAFFDFLFLELFSVFFCPTPLMLSFH